MTGPATATATTLTGIATLLALVPSGESAILIAFGALAFFGGCCARTAMILWRKLDGTDAITLPWFARQFAMLGCCVPLAIVASSLLFLGALALGTDVTKDAPPLWGLLLATGLRGPEGFSWLTGILGNIFTRFIPGQKPTPGGTP